MDASLHLQKIGKVTTKNLRFFCRETEPHSTKKSFGLVQRIKDNQIQWKEINFSLTETVQALKSRIYQQTETVSLFTTLH